MIKKFRELSKNVPDINLEGLLKSLTGHQYLVNEVNFRNSFPMVLQSYKFALLAQTTIKIIEVFFFSKLLMHFHDKNVIAVEKEDKNNFLGTLDSNLKNIRNSLSLLYTQKIEVQKLY